MADDTVNPFAQFAFSTGLSQERPLPAKRKVTSKQSTEKKKKIKSKSKSKKTKDWIHMADCSPEEQERIRIKWHSLADPKAPLQVRRFQIFVAARLHAQCQEPVVRKTMEALREQFVELNVDALAQCDPEVLAVVLSSVQYYNTKAKHLVTASLEIQSRFQGKVPESEALLRQITGIGPVMADLLAFVNTVKAHT
jgi:endonuclease III